MGATLQIKIDASAATEAVVTLIYLAPEFPDAIRAFLKSIPNEGELLVARFNEDLLNLGTTEIRASLLPAEFFVRFIDALKVQARERGCLR